jgi:hypothetical protein
MHLPEDGHNCDPVEGIICVRITQLLLKVHMHLLLLSPIRISLMHDHGLFIIYLMTYMLSKSVLTNYLQQNIALTFYLVSIFAIAS